MADSSTLVDRVKIFVESSGTGPFQLGNAVPAFRGSEALTDGLTYSYAVESGSDYEVGQGVYVLAVDQLLRAPTLSSAGGAPVAFPANVTINFTALAADLTAGLAGSGTVTSVQGNGGTTGLTLTGGPITGAGTLTLGGVLGVANGGTAGTTAAEARDGIGLGNVNNTSDANKPISAATQTALDGKVSLTDLTAPTGAGLVGYGEGLTGALNSTVLAKLRALSVTPDEALGTGESIAVNALPAIKRILDAGRPLRIPSGKTYVVEYDPASSIGGGNYSYAVKVPDNALILCEGGTIKLMNAAPNWCRTVSFEGADNVRVYGVLKIDGNAANVASGNEHMHGAFLYDTTNFYIEGIDSRNCFGDNVYIGGADNTRGSCDGYIGRVVGVTAGRKNLVGQAFDNVQIGSAWLDNTLGGSTVTGAAPDATDGDCLDLEPDSFDGSVKNRMSIAQLYTKGAGNDFTAGTAEAQAKAMILNIGSWVDVIVPRAGVPWHTHYGITLNIDDWQVSGITATSATAEIYYAARLNVGRCTIDGVRTDVSTPFFLSAYVTARPEINIDNLTITGSGTGFENRNGIVTLGHYKCRTEGLPFWNRSLAGTAGIISELTIETLDMLDVGQPSGAGYGFLVSHDGDRQLCRIGHIRFRDTRTPKLNFIGMVGDGAASGNIVGSVDNDTSVPLFGYFGADKFYRVSGGGPGAPGSFICTGTPENMISAPVGSMAYRIDGGAGTTVYKKESGTGNTGWVAL